MIKKPLHGILPIDDPIPAGPSGPLGGIHDIIFPEGGLPPIVSEGDVPVIVDLTGDEPTILPPTQRAEKDDGLDYFYTDSAFLVAASSTRKVPFREYLSGKCANYIRMKTNLQVTIRLTTDDESEMAIVIEADKPWWMRGLDFQHMEIDNTGNTSIATIDVIWSSKGIDVVQEQNINLIADSPDIYTPLSVVMAAAAAAVTANVLYSTLQTVLLISPATNTGIISLGDATLQVPTLNLNQSVEMSVRDLRNLYASSTVPGDVLHIIPLKR